MLSEFNKEKIFNLIKDNHSTVALDWHDIKDTLSVQVIHGDQDIPRAYPCITMDWRGMRRPVHGKSGTNFIAEETLYVEVIAVNYDKDGDPSSGDEIPGSVIARRIIADLIYEAENNWNASLTGLTPPVPVVPPIAPITGERGMMEDIYLYRYAFLMKFQYNINTTLTI